LMLKITLIISSAASRTAHWIIVLKS
jgi:hypothetical protein